MEQKFKNYLFTKNILVSESKEHEAINTWKALWHLGAEYGIRITQGASLADDAVLDDVANQYQKPEKPFYEHYPKSFLALSPEERAFNAIYHYVNTYGLGDFGTPGKALIEESFDFIPFAEDVDPKNMRIVSVDQALNILKKDINTMAKSTRPLSNSHYAVLSLYISVYGMPDAPIACKDTLAQLYIDLGINDLADALSLSDLFKMVQKMDLSRNDPLWAWCHPNKKLHHDITLTNQNKKRCRQFLDYKLSTAYSDKDLCECFEKRRFWKSLIYYLHYKPKDAGIPFVKAILYDKKNVSAYALVDHYLKTDNPFEAAYQLVKKKGVGGLLRHLDYILSRTKTKENREKILSLIQTDNLVLLCQLLDHYSLFTDDPRIFVFTNDGLVSQHTETEEEAAKRKTKLSQAVIEEITDVLNERLSHAVHQHQNSEWIKQSYLSTCQLLQDNFDIDDPDGAMQLALPPFNESTSSSGIGTLPTGTRLPLPQDKKLRLFTYWEKVDDIDLSMIALDEDFNITHPYSWQTVGEEGFVIPFSGDQTSGYRGGSEYYDLDIEAYRKVYPDDRYIALCDSVYSGIPFNRCDCRAGFMLRDKIDSGELFEPKAVKTAMQIDVDTTHAVLYLIDLAQNQIIWINAAIRTSKCVATEMSYKFLKKYFSHTVSLKDLYNMVTKD